MNLLRAGYTSIAFGCLIAYAGTQRSVSLVEGAESNLSPCELFQVQRALETIRAAGYQRAADDIHQLLVSGKLISDETLTGTYRGATTFPVFGDQVIRLNKSELFCSKIFWNRRNEPLYKQYVAERMVILSSTLVHEWWHSKCSYFWTVSHPFQREKRAWTYEAKFLHDLRKVKTGRIYIELIDEMSERVQAELRSC